MRVLELSRDPGMAADGDEALLTRRCFYLVESTHTTAGFSPVCFICTTPVLAKKASTFECFLTVQKVTLEQQCLFHTHDHDHEP